MHVQQIVQEFFATYAYRPWYVYTGVFGFMYASAFGLPLPEEIVLISAGFLAYAAKNPEVAPPPGAVGVNPHILALAAVIAVITSDCIIFFLGRTFGARILQLSFVRKYMNDDRQVRIQDWSVRYGFWASGIFRFTPGLRFPGHLFCGMSGMPLAKFLAVDGTAALLTIPPQIYLIAHYGDHILRYMKEFKYGLLAVLGMFAIFLLRTRRPRQT